MADQIVDLWITFQSEANSKACPNPDGTAARPLPRAAGPPRGRLGNSPAPGSQPASPALLRSRCAAPLGRPKKTFNRSLTLFTPMPLPIIVVKRSRERPVPPSTSPLRPCLMQFSTRGCSMMLRTSTSNARGSMCFSKRSLPYRTCSRLMALHQGTSDDNVRKGEVKDDETLIGVWLKHARQQKRA